MQAKIESSPKHSPNPLWVATGMAMWYPGTVASCNKLSTPKPCTGISLMSRAMLRRSLYTDLQTLQKLYEDLILSVSEFEELKSTLLEELKDLQPSKKV